MVCNMKMKVQDINQESTILLYIKQYNWLLHIGFKVLPPWIHTYIKKLKDFT